MSEEKISIDDFLKVEIKLGTVTSVSVIEGADKLYKLTVDFGEVSERQILSAIREYVKEEDLLGKQFPFITNLAPRTIRGYESNGMILAGSDNSVLTLLQPTVTIKNGTELK